MHSNRIVGDDYTPPGAANYFGNLSGFRCRFRRRAGHATFRGKVFVANPLLIPPVEKIAECLNRLRGACVSTTICAECLKEVSGREGLAEMIAIAKDLMRVGVVATIPCSRHRAIEAASLRLQASGV